jgi:hypothetical protein
MLTSEISRRAFAAAWFAVAASIPIGFYFLVDPLSSGTIYKIITIIGPILAAAIIGSWLGAAILDKTRSGVRAALRGLTIAALSYLFFFILEVISFVLYNPTLNTADDFFKLVYMLALMFGVGLLLFGWLIALVGAAAGALLYQLRITAVGETIHE